MENFPNRWLPINSAGEANIQPCDLLYAIAKRQSHRKFNNDPLSLTELAFLLWATQGVRERINEAAVLRSVPSAGCRHPFETYLAVERVEGLDGGVYRYLPLDLSLIHIFVSTIMFGCDKVKSVTGGDVALVKGGTLEIDKSLLHPQNLWVTAGSGRFPSV